MIYLLTRKEYVGYDEYAGKVIRACSKLEARQIANKDTGDEGRIWTDEDKVSCIEIPPLGSSEEILGSFCAG